MHLALYISTKQVYVFSILFCVHNTMSDGIILLNAFNNT